MSTAGIEIVDRALVRYSGTETNVVIDSDILTIADRAFAQNEKIESIVVNSPALRTIGREAFYGCKRLKKAHFSAIKGGIGSAAFKGCAALKCFVIPNGIMEIGSDAFRGCAAHFVLQIPSSVDVIGDNIVDSSAIIVSARPNEEINKYVDKNRIAIKKDLNTVLKQLETRRLIEREGEERQFNIFGESITASNTLRIYQEVLEYYQREKQRLIDLALAGLPTQLSLSETQRKAFLGVLESVNNGTKTLIKRVERWGIILPESTTFIDVLLPAAKLAKCGNLIIRGLTEGKNAADEMISDARNTLANEAESRVTGLSYGMLGSGLDMVLYSIDDFRERQRQRKAAYAEADRKLQQYASQTNSFANQQFAKLMKETAIPVFLSAISECCDALQKAELDTLKNEDLLVGTEPDIDDIVKSSKIIESSLSDSSRDKEYSVALALKKCPFNKGAYSIAANNGLVTDTLLALFAHVGLADEDGNDTSPDTHLLEKMMKTCAVSVDGLSEFCGNATVFGSALPKSVSEIVRGKLIKLLSDSIFPKLTVQYDGNNQQQITNAVIKSVSKYVLKENAGKLDRAGISVSECASHIANEKIRADQEKVFDAVLSSINETESLSDSIADIKENEAVLGDLSAKRLLQESISKCEKKLSALIENYAAHNTTPTIEQLKNELTDIINDNDLAYLRSKSEVVLQCSPASIDELIDILQARIENTRNKNTENEKKYIEACRLQEAAQSAKDYEAVAALFDELTLYKDSTARQIVCINKQQEIQEKDYADAVAALEKAKSKKALDAVSTQFAAISNYKDSKNHLTEIEKRKKGIKNRKIGLLIGILGAAIIAALVYYSAIIVPGNKYKAAEAMLEAGQYDAAIEAFTALGEYKDSAERLKETKEAQEEAKKKEAYDAATALLEAADSPNDYANAIAAFEAMNGYLDSNQRIEEAKQAAIQNAYNEAVTMMNRGDYENAAHAFAILGDYQDSSQLALQAEEAAKEQFYEKAKVFLEQGLIQEAAIAFGKAGDYSDGRAQSMALWDTFARRDTIAAGIHYSVGLRTDGTVVATGRNDFGQCNVSGWDGIIAVSSGGHYTLGLKSDGTVVATGNNESGSCDVAGWRDIVAIYAGDGCSVGIRIDGTLLVAGLTNDRTGIEEWKDIVAVSVAYGHITGIHPDGTVVDNKYDVSAWTDIVYVCADHVRTIGIKADGSVVVVGSNQKKVSGWPNIISLCSTSRGYVGLSSLGEVYCDLNHVYMEKARNWSGIVEISANADLVLGLRADGTVTAAGRSEYNDHDNYGQYNVRDWKDIKIPNP